MAKKSKGAKSAWATLLTIVMAVLFVYLGYLTHNFLMLLMLSLLPELDPTQLILITVVSIALVCVLSYNVLVLYMYYLRRARHVDFIDEESRAERIKRFLFLFSALLDLGVIFTVAMSFYVLLGLKDMFKSLAQNASIFSLIFAVDRFAIAIYKYRHDLI